MSDGHGSLRPLAPSRRTVGSSAAEHEQPTPPVPDTTQDNMSDHGHTASGAEHPFMHRSRKRRAPAHVSLNACTNCKKARSKCDGMEPAPCSRCQDRGSECHYEVHIKTAKEEMMRRIKDLEQLHRSEKERSTLFESFIRTLAMSDQGPEIIARLKQGQSLKQIAEFLGDPSYQSIARLSPTSERLLRAVLQQDTVLDDATSPTDSMSRWNSAPDSDDLKQHLLSLYMTWFHPVHMLFSWKHFVSSLKAGGAKSPLLYCTPAMINLMCAIGCTLFVDPSDTPEIDPKRCLVQFQKQALSELADEDETKPTWAISYAMLFLLELSIGQARKAGSHLRMAVESLARVDRTGYDDSAFEIMAWGIHTLSTTWAAFTYVKPHNPKSTHAPVFQSISQDWPEEPWRSYRFPSDNGLPEDQVNFQRSSFAIQTAKELAKLNQIIHETMNVYCGSRGKVTGSSIVALYKRYINWRSSLPHEIRARSRSQMAPHIIHIHVYFCVALCQLFQPLLQSGRFPAATVEFLRNIIIKTAKEGLDLLHSFGKHYTHRYHTPMQVFCLVHLGDALLQADQVDTEAAIRFTLSSLDEARQQLAIAGPLAAMFCQRAIESGTKLPDELIQELLRYHRYGMEEKLDTCERVTYAQPIEQLLGRLEPNIAVQFEREWQIYIDSRGGDTASGDVSSHINGLGATPESDTLSDTLSRRSSETSAARRPLDVNSLINP